MKTSVWGKSILALVFTIILYREVRKFPDNHQKQSDKSLVISQYLTYSRPSFPSILPCLLTYCKPNRKFPRFLNIYYLPPAGCNFQKKTLDTAFLIN